MPSLYDESFRGRSETMPQVRSRLTVRVGNYGVECICGVWHWVVQLTREAT